MNKKALYFELIYILWAATIIVVVALTMTNVKKQKCKYYDIQIAASTLAQTAMEKIKVRKNELGIPLEELDINETGIIGPNVMSFDTIQTTMGKVESKRTITNPNTAALIVKLLYEAGVRENDEINIICSGSFPAFNIAVLAASQVLNLKTCIMCSIGASQYGATNDNFTFFDMTEYLYNQGIFTNKVDYLSWGGGNDCGVEFSSSIKELIYPRILASGVKFIYEEDFATNVEKRMEYYQTKNPQAKVLINSGGSLVAVGDNESIFDDGYGLIKPNYLLLNKNKKQTYVGIMESFLIKGVSVINLENISYLTKKYDMEYDPSPLPKIGEGNIYYDTKYDLVLPIITIIITIGLLITYNIMNKKPKRKDEHHGKNILR